MRAAARSRPINLFCPTVWLIVIYLGIDYVFNSLANQQQQLIYSDTVSPFIDLLATAALLFAAKQSFRHSRRLGIAWGLIGLSARAFALGDIVWAILELGLNEPPFPSWADVFYLVNYPLWLAGILLLPEKPATHGEQIKKVADLGVVIVAAFLVLWNFLIGPVVASNADYPLLEQAILLAYPVGDLVLLWTLFRIVYRQAEQHEENEVPTFLLAASLAVTIVADCLYTRQALLGTYVSGGLLDISWRAGMLVAGLAGISQVTVIGPSEITRKFPYRLELFISKGEVNHALSCLRLADRGLHSTRSGRVDDLTHELSVAIRWCGRHDQPSAAQANRYLS